MFLVALTCDYRHQTCADKCNKTMEYQGDSFTNCIIKAQSKGWMIDEERNIHVCPEHAWTHFGVKNSK